MTEEKVSLQKTCPTISQERGVDLDSTNISSYTYYGPIFLCTYDNGFISLNDSLGLGYYPHISN